MTSTQLPAEVVFLPGTGPRPSSAAVYLAIAAITLSSLAAGACLGIVLFQRLPQGCAL